MTPRVGKQATPQAPAVEKPTIALVEEAIKAFEDIRDDRTLSRDEVNKRNALVLENLLEIRQRIIEEQKGLKPSR